MRPLRWALVLSALLVVACGCVLPGSSPSAAPDASGFSSATATASPVAAARPACAGSPAPTSWQHVIWIWFENKSYSDVIGSADASYLNQLARSCAVATNYHGVTHPSLPNYLAATSGSTHGVTDDAGPDAHPVSGPSLFTQVAASGRQWRSYDESMPHSCALQPAGAYAVKHNPAAYYTSARAQCQRWDVSLDPLATDLRRGTLPAFALVTPNLCHDTHDCPVGTGDAWLHRVLPVILSSPAYRAGGTAVFVTWDEDDNSHVNRVPMIAIAPSVRPNTRIGGRLNHYALLRTTEQLLGLPPLGAARSASSFAASLTG